MTYKYEEKRLAKKRAEYSAFSILSYNRVILFNLIHLLMLAVIYMFLGVKGVLFQVVYAWIIVMMVDSTNYVEHYGLKLK